MCASFLHLTYKMCASDLLRLFIWLIKCSASDLQKVCIQPSKVCNRYTVCRIHKLFFNWVCIRYTVYRTNRSWKLLNNHVRVGPKNRRTDVTLGRCNTIENAYYFACLLPIPQFYGPRCKIKDFKKVSIFWAVQPQLENTFLSFVRSYEYDWRSGRMSSVLLCIGLSQKVLITQWNINLIRFNFLSH